MTQLSTTIPDFLLERQAARYSANTLRCYRVTFKKLANFLGDIPFRDISRTRIIEFLSQQTDISAKTLRNYHADLSALWEWAVQRDLCDENIMRTIRMPIPEKKEVIPLERAEILALISQSAESSSQVIALRNKAILYTLLDTGVRASELCGLKIQHINQVTKRLVVFGKGRKERQIPVSDDTLAVIKNYLKQNNSREWVFTTFDNRPLSRHRLADILETIGNHAGVAKVYPHRFRHTFAIQFLRNGGNIYSLQRILGHTTLDMVKRYLAISQVDLDRDHAAASPVTHWLV
jgi:site-specific recombinase XerD